MRPELCSLCNEPVPAQDLKLGRAYHRGPRLICATCDRAMGGGGSAPLGNAEEEPRSGPGILWPLVALTGLGIGAWGLWQAREAGEQVQRMRATLAGFEVRLDDRMKGEARERLALAESLQLDLRGQLQKDQGSLRADWQGAEQELRIALQNESAASRERAAAAEQRQTELQTAFGELQKDYTGLLAGVQAFEEETRKEFETWRSGMEGMGQAVQQIEDTLREPAFGLPGDEGAPWYPITADLLHNQASVRLEAIYSLEQSHDARICNYLLPLLSDPDSLVRVATARILAEHNFRLAVPGLIDCLEHADLAVRDGALTALRSITGRQFGFRAEGRETERRRPLQAWRDWWAENGQDFLLGQTS
ncbi:MAG: HEAT repeat domain-containing protein [Planctomycetota bacterium]